LPCWLEPAKPLAASTLPTQYYRNEPMRIDHKPYTNDTSTTVITDEHFLPYEVQLGLDHQLTLPVLQLLAANPSVSWRQQDLTNISQTHIPKHKRTPRTRKENTKVARGRAERSKRRFVVCRPRT
jgi:hypothetical protein